MLIEIKTYVSMPIYEQLRNQIVLGIAAKELIPCERLPSVRNLAADLGINFHTVNKAYSMLCDEGYIVMDRRQGAVVAQEMPNGESIFSNLSQQLLISAAEAVCHGIDEKGFLSICADCYKKATTITKNTENGGC